MNANAAYGLLTLIQDRAATLLSGAGQAKMPRFAGLVPLREQLRDRALAIPRTFLFDLSALLDELHVLDMADGGGGQDLRQKLQARFRDFGKDLADGKGVNAVARIVDDLRDLGALQHLPEVFVGLISRQVGIGISFVTTLRNLADPDLVALIPNGWLQYFFSDAGFETVDGIAITAPGHDQLRSALAEPITAETVKGLKSLVSERSAAQYVRDLIRITVEVASDTRYSRNGRNLRQRHQDLLELVGADNAEKARRWFKGAASLSESLVTSAVEEATLGVSEFQTNAVIAAAAATFAGTVARKATQHVFLAEVGV